MPAVCGPDSPTNKENRDKEVGVPVLVPAESPSRPVAFLATFYQRIEVRSIDQNTTHADVASATDHRTSLGVTAGAG